MSPPVQLAFPLDPLDDEPDDAVRAAVEARIVPWIFGFLFPEWGRGAYTPAGSVSSSPPVSRPGSEPRAPGTRARRRPEGRMQRHAGLHGVRVHR